MVRITLSDTQYQALNLILGMEMERAKRDYECAPHYSSQEGEATVRMSLVMSIQGAVALTSEMQSE